jgi:flagellar FliL protein
MADEDEPKAEDEKAEGTENAEGAGEGEGGEGEDGEESGGGKKKLIIIVAAVVLLLVGGGAGAYFTGMLDGLLGKEPAAEEMKDGHGDDHGDAHGDDHGKDDHGKGHGDDYGDDYGYSGGDDHGDDHGDKDDHGGKDDGHAEKSDDGHGKEGKGGGGKFVVVPTMLVNLNTDDDTPRYLRLSVQIELKSASDYGAVEAVIPRVVDQFQTYLRELRVRDLRGSAGIYRLQMELLWRVNQAAKPVRVKDVLFQEILIQ